MTISRKSLRVLLMTLGVVFMISISFFLLTTSMSGPTDNTLAGIEQASENDMKHCILLEKDQAFYISNGVKNKIEYVDLEQAVINKMDLLQQTTVNIICTREVSYQQIKSVLDIITAKNIKDYQLLKI